jgi:hypothetical protein
MYPMASRNCLESKEVFQSELSVFSIFHPGAGMLHVCCYSDTLQDPSLSNGILASDDSSIQLHGDRDKIKGRASARHGDARVLGKYLIYLTYARTETKTILQLSCLSGFTHSLEEIKSFAPPLSFYSL